MKSSSFRISRYAMLSHFSRVRLCATPETAAHQAPPSLVFSRQEHWSGVPFPSPMHESEKSKWSRSVVSNPQRPHGLQPTRLLRPWDFPGKSTGVGCHCHIQVYTFVNLAWNQWTYPQAKGEVLDDFMSKNTTHPSLDSHLNDDLGEKVMMVKTAFLFFLMQW